MLGSLYHMTGLFVLVIILASVWCGSIAIKLNNDTSPDPENLRRPKTQTPGSLFVRLRLLVHVLCNGCRIVAAEHLECRKCEYGSICQDGYFTPKA
jgi:hypothetical protein